jgi:hypothetical protein
MSFDVMKITRPLDLGDYDEQYRGQVLQVWVNPPRAVRKEREDLLREFNQMLRRSVAAETAAPPLSPRPFPILRLPFDFAQGRRSGRSGEGNWFERLFARKQVDDFGRWQRQSYAWLAQILGVAEPYTADDLERLHDADEVLYQWILKRVVEMITQFQAEKKRPSNLPSMN